MIGHQQADPEHCQNRGNRQGMASDKRAGAADSLPRPTSIARVRQK